MLCCHSYGNQIYLDTLKGWISWTKTLVDPDLQLIRGPTHPDPKKGGALFSNIIILNPDPDPYPRFTYAKLQKKESCDSSSNIATL